MHKWILTALTLLLVTMVAAQEPKKPAGFPGIEKADIWVIAGQSNAGGYGLVKSPTKPDPRIMHFNIRNEWEVAEEPLFKGFTRQEFQVARAVRDNIILQRPSDLPTGEVLERFLREADESGRKLVGVSFGRFFAEHLLKTINRPIGLVPFGTRTIKQWDPKATDNLYPNLKSKIQAAGGKVKGFVYYQGETDVAIPANAPVYEQDLLGLIDNVRRVLESPDLPFIVVQLGRCARRGSAQLIADWERVREGQRLAVKQRKNTYLTSAIDLPTDDAVHISFEGQQKLGRRLAEIALGEIYGLPGHARTIDFASMEVINPGGERPMIRVRFSGVTGRLRAEGRPHGFELRPATAKDDQYHAVYRVDLDPNDPSALIVGIFHPFTDAPYNLFYGAGIDPYVNIVDDKDIPIPAFGPIAVEIPKAKAQQ